MRRNILFTLPLFAIFTGCSAPETPDRFTGPPHENLVVAVWTEPSSWLTPELAVAGCNIWAPDGVSCAPAAASDQADAIVAVDLSECRHAVSGLAIGARSVLAEHRVIVFEQCVSPAERRDGTLMLHLLGHQFGHLLGILADVPATCEADSPVLPGLRGGPICGLALMNSNIDSLFAWMTVIDDRAFRARDLRWAIGRPRALPVMIQAPPPDCEFLLPNADH